MINLVRNEITKIMKKKSLYIMLALLIAVIVIANVGTKLNSKTQNYPIEEEISHYENYLSQLNPDKASDTSSYIEIKTELDTLKLVQHYGQGTWQGNLASEKASEYIKEMNTYQYGSEKNEEMLKKIEQKYDNFIRNLDKGDWKDFAKTELEEINEKIAAAEKQKEETVDKMELSSIEAMIKDLKIEKQVVEWRIQKDISYASGYWDDTLERYGDSKSMTLNYEATPNQNDYEQKQRYYGNLKRANTNQYAIEHNQEVTNQSTARGMLMETFNNYEILIIIVIVMIAGAIVSEEFNKGTIKLLLVKPYKRSKILLSKFLACICMILLTIGVVIGLQFIIGGITFGFDSLSLPVVVYNFQDQALQTMNLIQYLGVNLLAKLPFYGLIATIAFAFSAIFNNTALAVVISLLGYMSTSIINQLAQMQHMEMVKFFITPNWDFSQFLFGGLPALQYTNFGLAIGVCIFYFLAIMIPTFLIFKRKNIKNI